jgi:catechol 2,3-dioxygenase-like lactoylglutathione lyase family enzyme
MSSTDVKSDRATEASGSVMMDMKLEVAVIPVADVDRAKRFYGSLGWRQDADFVIGDDFRIVQFTPPGSGCSIQFGRGVTPAAPGTSGSLYLIVTDIEAAREELIGNGVAVSEVFHEGAGGARFRADRSFASFSDPDGNPWLLQEITTRLADRVDGTTAYSSADDLEQALIRAATAHGEHEKRTGKADAEWPVWYAKYMVAERAGVELPQ